ncbi:hypothetical protein LIER_38417 [Lithospermum erythrorhizon]|uniref:Uncharacterized protein n=1 Tax=Lithospermum erythrorhizon TaxID=34254 RepID=A0AAV3PZL4_LITER
MISMQNESDRSSGSNRGHDRKRGEMSTSNFQCQRSQGRDAGKRSKFKSSKTSKIEAVERVVECHDDYMTFRKKKLERYEVMEAAKLRTKNMKLYMKLKEKPYKNDSDKKNDGTVGVNAVW